MNSTLFSRFIGRSFFEITTLVLALVIATAPAAAQLNRSFSPNLPGTNRTELLPPTPIVFPSATSCADLNASANPALAHIQGDHGFRFPDPPTGTYPFVNSSVTTLTGGAPADPGNSLSIQLVTPETINWTSTKAITAVIVSDQSGQANVYPYPIPSFGDNGLVGPDPAEWLDGVEFCYQMPATVTIIKEVTAFDGGTQWNISFPFSATNLGVSNFSLIDLNAQPADRFVSQPIYNFGPTHSITVTEGIVNSWSLSDIECTETAAPGHPHINNSSGNVQTSTATIIVESGESVTCVFRNLQVVPTAATATVSGRVLDAIGNGIVGARLSITNLATGERRYAVSNPFGRYTIDGLSVAEFYVLTVEHRKVVFADSSRSFMLNDDLQGIDFIAGQ